MKKQKMKQKQTQNKGYTTHYPYFLQLRKENEKYRI